jgi:hypothetical protein
MNAMAARWVQNDGAPVSCTEKLRVLEENYAELAQVMQDAFDDAILMDVDEGALRAMFAAMVATLKSPRA